MCHTGHGKVIEKTLPGQSLGCRGVLGIVLFGGAEGTIGGTLKLSFTITY